MKINLGFISAWRDIQNYRGWIRTIREESANPDSLYNKFGFENNYTGMIYLPIILKDEYTQVPDKVKKLRVVELLNPVNRYLDEELNFGEYLEVDFNQVIDEEGEETNTYMIAYVFTFQTISLLWILKRSILVGSLIWAGFRYLPQINYTPAIDFVLELIKSL